MSRLEGARILHVLGASAFGGGSKVILDLAAEGMAEGASVDILTTNDQMAREAAQLGAGVVPLRAIERSIHPVRDVVGLVRLVQFLRKERYDIVHTHTSKAGIIGRIAAGLVGVKFIVHTLHGFAFHDRSPKWVIGAAALAERIGALFCHQVVSVSQTHYQVAKKLKMVPSSKLRAIPNGIPFAGERDESRIRQIRLELTSSDDDIMVLCHGRLAPGKGVEDLIDALAIMREKSTLPAGVRVAIAGDGPIAEELQGRVAERGLRDIVGFLGFRTDIASLLDSADLVVLPSLREGLSISLMEAMSRGCLIAVSDIPNNLELIKHGRNGVVFPVSDPVGLANTLTDLLGDTAGHEALAVQARRDLEATHGVARMRDAYLGVYVAGLTSSSRSGSGAA